MISFFVFYTTTCHAPVLLITLFTSTQGKSTSTRSIELIISSSQHPIHPLRSIKTNASTTAFAIHNNPISPLRALSSIYYNHVLTSFCRRHQKAQSRRPTRRRISQKVASSRPPPKLLRPTQIHDTRSTRGVAQGTTEGAQSSIGRGIQSADQTEDRRARRGGCYVQESI